MMRAISFAIALSISALGARAFAQDVSTPDALVKRVTLEVLDTIAKDKDIQAGDRSKTSDLIERKVLPHFNFSGMTALALGASWRRASAEQKKLLTEEFKTLLLRTYASALASYQGQKLEFRPLRAKAGERELARALRAEFGQRPLLESGRRFTTSMRPAKLSATCGRVSTLADPVSKKRPGRRSSSTERLMARSSSGARCTSSIGSAPEYALVGSVGGYDRLDCLGFQLGKETNEVNDSDFEARDDAVSDMLVALREVSPSKESEAVGSLRRNSSQARAKIRRHNNWQAMAVSV